MNSTLFVYVLILLGGFDGVLGTKYGLKVLFASFKSSSIFRCQSVDSKLKQSNVRFINGIKVELNDNLKKDEVILTESKMSYHEGDVEVRNIGGIRVERKRSPRIAVNKSPPSVVMPPKVEGKTLDELAPELSEVELDNLWQFCNPDSEFEIDSSMDVRDKVRQFGMDLKSPEVIRNPTETINQFFHDVSMESLTSMEICSLVAALGSDKLQQYNMKSEYFYMTRLLRSYFKQPTSNNLLSELLLIGKGSSAFGTKLSGDIAEGLIGRLLLIVPQLNPTELIELSALWISFEDNTKVLNALFDRLQKSDCDSKIHSNIIFNLRSRGVSIQSVRSLVLPMIANILKLPVSWKDLSGILSCISVLKPSVTDIELLTRACESVLKNDNLSDSQREHIQKQLVLPLKFLFVHNSFFRLRNLRDRSVSSEKFLRPLMEMGITFGDLSGSKQTLLLEKLEAFIGSKAVNKDAIKM